MLFFHLLGSIRILRLGRTDFDGETGRQLHLDEILQFGKVGTGDGHQVDYGHDLFGQAQREGVAQPQIGSELLNLGRHLLGAADVALAQVHAGVEVLGHRHLEETQNTTVDIEAKTIRRSSHFYQYRPSLEIKKTITKHHVWN